MENLNNIQFPKIIMRALTIIVILTLTFSNLVSQTISEKDIINKAKLIHDKTLLIDSHVDIPGNRYGTKDRDPGIDNPKLRCDLVKMEKGGVDGVFLIAFTNQVPEFDDKAYEKADSNVMKYFSGINRILQKYPYKCELAVSPSDVIRISKEGKRAIMIGMENGYPLGKDISKLKKYYDLGTRYIGLCHWRNNQICDASTSKEPKHNGISDFPL